MATRFRKSVKITDGVKMNVTKSGVSTSFGGKGGSVNVSGKGTRTTVGVPGSGVSYTSYSSGGSKKKQEDDISTGVVIGVLVCIVIAFFLVKYVLGL